MAFKGVPIMKLTGRLRCLIVRKIRYRLFSFCYWTGPLIVHTLSIIQSCFSCSACNIKGSSQLPGNNGWENIAITLYRNVHFQFKGVHTLLRVASFLKLKASLWFLQPNDCYFLPHKHVLLNVFLLEPDSRSFTFVDFKILQLNFIANIVCIIQK